MNDACSTGRGQAEAMNVGHHLQIRQMDRYIIRGILRRVASSSLPPLSARILRL